MKFLLLLLFSAQVFASPVSSELLENVGLAATFSGNAMTIRLKTGAGNDPSVASPVRIAFRSATASSGAFLIRKATAALSTVVSSGSTAGCAASVECEVYVYALDNAGTVELAWSTTYWTDELQTTTAEGGAGAADSATTLYSTTARTTKAVRLLGILYVTQATPGTWVTSPHKIRLMPFKIELGSQFIAGLQYTGSGVTTTSGSVVDISGLPSTFSFLGLGTQVGSDFKVRVAGAKPGLYHLTSHFIMYGQGAIATGCEAYGNSTVGGFGYAQTSQSNSTVDGPTFGVHLSGVRVMGSYVAGNVDYYVRWRRVAGAGNCHFHNGSGDAAYIYIYRQPYINGQVGRL